MATPERLARRYRGALVVAGILAALLLSLVLVVGTGGSPAAAALFVIVVVASLLISPGLIVVPPNQARVMVFFGRYIGSVREAGFWWINPFTIRQRVSLKIRNFESDVLKVNDAVGNPVEIAAVITWQVVDTARALFDVEYYIDFVRVQAESSVRHVASQYPYDAYEEGAHSLQGSVEEVMETLQSELQGRLADAGVSVLDTRLRHLAYAPEIAGEMLRRQQASAVVAARHRIVEGAVGMVKMALEQLSEQGIVELDEERKAAMVSNLMVVLVSDRGAQPVVNSGTLYT